MNRGLWRTSLGAATLLAVTVIVGAATAGGHGTRGHAAFQRQCRDPFGGTRDPHNPLMLRAQPGSNPLDGASFFVNGPRHGAAAATIAQLLGIDPTTYPDDYSWARFKADLDGGRLHDELAGKPQLQHKVSELEKIAS